MSCAIIFCDTFDQIRQKNSENNSGVLDTSPRQNGLPRFHFNILKLGGQKV
jgi:hypothetical protein